MHLSWRASQPIRERRESQVENLRKIVDLEMIKIKEENVGMSDKCMFFVVSSLSIKLLQL